MARVGTALLLTLALTPAAADELQYAALENLWEALNGPNESVAEAAAVSLSERGPEGLAVLMRGLTDGTAVAQAYAARALGEAAHRAAAPHMLALLGKQQAVAVAAAQGLVALGVEDERVTKRLLDLARYGEQDVAAQAERALFKVPQTLAVLDFLQGRLGAHERRWRDESGDVASHLARSGEAGKRRLLAALRSRNPGARWAGLHGLRAIAGPEDISAIAAVARSGQEPNRYAAQVLGGIRHPRSVAVLAELADTDNEYLGRAAVEALGRLDLPETVPPLIEAAMARGRRHSADAIRQLGRKDDTRALDALATVLREDDGERRRQAARALSAPPLAEAGPLLLVHVGDPDPEIRRAVVNSVGYLKHEGAIPDLGRTLHEDEEADCRTAAAEALGRIGTEAALAALRAVKPDALPHDVPLAAGLALARHNDPGGVDLLAANWPFSPDRDAALQALARYRGDDRAFEALTAALQDEHASTRRDAVFRLGDYGDPRAGDALAVAMERFGREEVQFCLAVARALMRIGDARGPDALEAMARDGAVASRWRLEAVGSLASAEGRHEEYVALLTDLMGDPDEEVASAARLRLRRMRYERSPIPGAAGGRD